jgi:dinuclear metal center YbgI/SA1388 family protein
MGTTVHEVCAALDSIAPPEGVLPGDPNGLLLGNGDAPISTLLVALDCTAEVAMAAAREKEAMVVAHHPLLYHPLRTLRVSDPFPAPVIAFCLEHNIPFACAHSSWDIAPGGVNDVLAGLLKLTNVRPLAPNGLGRIGTLPAPTTVGNLLTLLKAALFFDALRTFAEPDQPITVVAVGGGACAGLVPDAIAAGAQALVTSDVRHHEFIDAQHRGFALIDAGHRETEQPGVVELAARLAQALPGVRVLPV